MESIGTHDPGNVNWRTTAALNHGRNENTILPHFRAAYRYPDLLSHFGFRIDMGQHDLHQDGAKQAHILALLRRGRLAPKPAKTEASSSIYICDPIDEILQPPSPLIRCCSTGCDVRDFIADLADEVGSPVGALIAPGAS